MLNEFPFLNGVWKNVVSGLFYRSLLFDEFLFHVSEFVNIQSIRIWGGGNTREIKQREFHSDIVTVCCAVHDNIVIRPCFFNIETLRGVDFYQMMDK